MSKGDSVMLTCNRSIKNATQVNWKKDRFLFSYTPQKNFSNFTSHNVRIDPGLTTELNINVQDVQEDDAGLYICTVTNKEGIMTTSWNLTVTKKPEGR